ncbi:hypothetical protein HYH03_008946 [Edaphochlamys debaryana]|uniref:Uncharacterized protein n=1 Tax=Edaphochlamys debaryana TaxID=47281 RepID=A0A835Y5C7_9CHLO|nr:hypothetical protein HYH03_008946 [Edaphochlamys debaryana]|eukprot:KAG2492785.1 hypothetical protein HYH03_008946 [Edaphochlamys debaryana]
MIVTNLFHATLRGRSAASTANAHTLLRTYVQAVGSSCNDEDVRRQAFEAARAAAAAVGAPTGTSESTRKRSGGTAAALARRKVRAASSVTAATSAAAEQPSAAPAGGAARSNTRTAPAAPAQLWTSPWPPAGVDERPTGLPLHERGSSGGVSPVSPAESGGSAQSDGGRRSPPSTAGFWEPPLQPPRPPAMWARSPRNAAAAAPLGGGAPSQDYYRPPPAWGSDFGGPNGGSTAATYSSAGSGPGRALPPPPSANAAWLSRAPAAPPPPQPPPPPRAGYPIGFESGSGLDRDVLSELAGAVGSSGGADSSPVPSAAPSFDAAAGRAQMRRPPSWHTHSADVADGTLRMSSSLPMPPAAKAPSAAGGDWGGRAPASPLSSPAGYPQGHAPYGAGAVRNTSSSAGANPSVPLGPAAAGASVSASGPAWDWASGLPALPDHAATSADEYDRISGFACHWSAAPQARPATWPRVSSVPYDACAWAPHSMDSCCTSHHEFAQQEHWAPPPIQIAPAHIAPPHMTPTHVDGRAPSATSCHAPSQQQQAPQSSVWAAGLGARSGFAQGMRSWSPPQQLWAAPGRRTPQFIEAQQQQQQQQALPAAPYGVADVSGLEIPSDIVNDVSMLDVWLAMCD